MYDIDGNWIKKVTYLIGIVFCFFAASCRSHAKKEFDDEMWQHTIDSIGNATLDSIYKKQMTACDSLQKIKIPILVDSIIKNDSLKRLLDKKKNNG